MHANYSDITDRIDEPPIWWDENAVPRYCPFTPNDIANIYADEAVLLAIECQGCSTPFLVAITHSRYNVTFAKGSSLEDVAEQGRLHFGDPPNSGCCAAGPVMNSIPIRVVEFWTRKPRVGDKGYRNWERIEKLEGAPQE